MTLAPPSPLHAFITARTGMALSGPQRRRLEERVAALRGARSEQQYLLYLQSPAGASELAELIAAVVVHKTDLFRDEVQLAAFQTHVLAPLVRRERRPLRVWSAGCATGEEVATLLVMLAEAGADPGSRVLGTDISESALARARLLRFSQEQLRRVPSPLRERWFTQHGAGATLLPSLRERASFQFHNLMDAPYPVPEEGEGFDIVFCRNVLIYFTAEAFERAVVQLSERLAPGGTLVLSAAEPLLQVPPSLRALRSENAFFYVRAAPGEVAEVQRLQRDSGRFAAVGALERGRESGSFPSVGPRARPDSGRFPAVSPAAPPPPVRDSGHFPALPPAALSPVRDSGHFPALPPAAPLPPVRDSDRFASVSPATPLSPVRDSGRFPAVPPASVPAPPAPELDAGALAEADALFLHVLEGTGGGQAGGDARTEEDLRRCLALDPDLAAARFLLGMLLELRDAPTEAAGEYRRALRSLEEGRAREVPFFLNPVRLRVACARAIERTEEASRPR